MALILPSFDGELDSLVVCGLYCDDDRSRFGWLDDDTYRITARQKTAAGTAGVWISVERGKDGRHGHFHVDAGIESAFTWIEKNLEYRRVRWPEVSRLFQRVAGLPVQSRATADFTVANKKLPKRGIVTSLIGLQTESHGTEMAISAVEFQIRDEVFRSARVRATEESSCDVELKFRAESEVGDEYLQFFAELGREGLESFILEKPRTPTDVDSLRKRSPRVRRA